MFVNGTRHSLVVIDIYRILQKGLATFHQDVCFEVAHFYEIGSAS